MKPRELETCRPLLLHKHINTFRGCKFRSSVSRSFFYAEYFDRYRTAETRRCTGNRWQRESEGGNEVQMNIYCIFHSDNWYDSVGRYENEFSFSVVHHHTRPNLIYAPWSLWWSFSLVWFAGVREVLSTWQLVLRWQTNKTPAKPDKTTFSQLLYMRCMMSPTFKPNEAIV